ncbi:MAG: hypothetical protein WCI57_04285 [Candidatus Berkelbacteria bacterium]
MNQAIKLHNAAAGFYERTGIRLTVRTNNLPPDWTVEIIPDTRITGTLPPKALDGMTIIGYQDGTYETSEQLAGPTEDELWIYKQTPYLTVALRELAKGNNRLQDTIQTWR